MEQEIIENTNTETLDNQPAEFSIPEEYQDKGWTKFFDGKTGDDLKAELFKSYDSTQSLIGKRVGDYIGSTDLKNLENWEEIKEKLLPQIAPHYQTPAEATAYELNKLLLDEEGNEKFFAPQEALDTFANGFKELGLSVEQAHGIFNKYMEFETEQFQKYTNADELEASINEMFGGDSKQRQTCESLIKEFLPIQDQKFIQDTMPNNVVEMFYKLAKGLNDKYGYTESPMKDNPNRLASTAQEKNAQYDELYKQLTDLSKRPHTKEEKDNILAQMNNLFR